MKKFFNSMTFVLFTICWSFMWVQQCIVGFTEDFVLKNNDLLALHTWVTSMFMHGSWFHFVANMIGVLSIGYTLESIIGKKKFLFIYLISGLIGAMVQVGLDSFKGIDIGYLGASGALCGIVGAWAFYRPKEKILFLFFPMRVITSCWVIVSISIAFYVAEFFGHSYGVGHLVHAFGLISGYFIATKIQKRLIFDVTAKSLSGESFSGILYSVDEIIFTFLEYPANFQAKGRKGCRQLTKEETDEIQGIQETFLRVIDEFKKQKQKEDLDKLDGMIEELEKDDE